MALGRAFRSILCSSRPRRPLRLPDRSISPRPFATQFISQLRPIGSFPPPSNDSSYECLVMRNWINYSRTLSWFCQIENRTQGSLRFMSSGQDESVEVTVPFMGESVRDGTIASFLKKPGDQVEVDDVIAQIETDKVTIDVRSSASGVIEKLAVNEGDTVTPGTVVASVVKGGAASVAKGGANNTTAGTTKAPSVKATETKEEPKPQVVKATASKPVVPALEVPANEPTEPKLPPKERERRVPMTRLRKRVATRLKDSQNTFAMLTTFNEVDMTNLMELRSQYNEKFQEKHGVKLGFMSCFVKAAVSALEQQPVVNAVIDGDDIIYRDYIDISIAVGTKKGLVVPVIRGAENMNFADIEKRINLLATKANDGSISIDDMAGGTFTISNGGVYGSLLSTPIINPPQKRPMVVKDTIVARPMMFIALTYDHRLIDGREAVYFLRRIKDVVEDPKRLLIDV